MSNPHAATPAPDVVRAATRATYMVFIGSGFAFASWASRIPQVKDKLHLTPSSLGLMLLAIAAGSLLALPLSGPVITRLGSRRTVTVTGVLLPVGLATAALGYLVGFVPVVVGLFLLGLGNGAWDVAMNIQGAVVEQQLGRSIMSRFHAGFSIGTVAGAGLGAAMVAVRMPVPIHLTGVAVLVAAVVPAAAQRFVPDHSGDDPAEAAAAPQKDRRGAFAAWREPRTLLIGVFVLAFAFAEGTGNDWISVASIDDHHVSAVVATLTFAVFLAAMTVGRWFGPGLLDRYGRVAVVRAVAGFGIAGIIVFVFVPSAPLAFLGALLWGLGASLGFPVGMSAGADEPEHAAGRVSTIASIGYCAFLAGPPVIGFLGDHFTVLRALITVGVLLSVAVLISRAVAPPSPRRLDDAPAADRMSVQGRPSA